jgi:hypothetical protein
MFVWVQPYPPGERAERVCIHQVFSGDGNKNVKISGVLVMQQSRKCYSQRMTDGTKIFSKQSSI